jgi:EAL and modified HD-GYP domain-containing signal transduction protein
VLEQVLAWEAGKLTSQNMQPQRIQRMATIYLEATQWADQVYASANGKPETDQPLRAIPEQRAEHSGAAPAR